MDYIHDSQKVLGGNGDMLHRWCGSARRSTVYRDGIGGRGPLKDRGQWSLQY